MQLISEVCGAISLFPFSCMLPSRLLRPITRGITARYISNETSASIARLKRPNRGGQNLTERHKRLEKSLRGKESRLSKINDLPASSSPGAISTAKSKLSQRLFRGFVVPEVPKPPEPDGARIFMSQFLIRNSDYSCYERMLYVRLRDMRPRPLPRITRHIQ